MELVLLSAGEIPRELAAGRIHLGVTGSDLVRDKLADWAAQVQELAQLGFGHADLIIAVPVAWIDVDTVDDLDAAAAAFRKTHGFRLRIATKYHRLVREYLTEQGVADYQLVDSQGATEGTVKNLTAEAIADITSSGETLRANHLKILSDGLVHASQATLFAARGRNGTRIPARHWRFWRRNWVWWPRFKLTREGGFSRLSLMGPWPIASMLGPAARKRAATWPNPVAFNCAVSALRP